LANRDLVEALEAVGLWNAHVDEFGVHGFDIRENQQLFDAGVFEHVAFQIRIGVPPLPGGKTEEGDIQEVGLRGIGCGSLGKGDFWWDEVCLDGVRVDAVVQLGKCAIEIPSEREAAVFVFFEALEFNNQVELELGRNP